MIDELERGKAITPRLVYESSLNIETTSDTLGSRPLETKIPTNDTHLNRKSIFSYTLRYLRISIKIKEI